MIQSSGSILQQEIASDEDVPLFTRCSQTNNDKEKETHKNHRAEPRTTNGKAVANINKQCEPQAAAAPAIEAAAPVIGKIINIRTSNRKFKNNYNGFEATILEVLTRDYKIIMQNCPKSGSRVCPTKESMDEKRSGKRRVIYVIDTDMIQIDLLGSGTTIQAISNY